MTMMESKILIVTQTFPPENFGNASRIYDLSKNLIKLGSQVVVLSPHSTFPFGSFKKKWRLYSKRTIDGIKNINIYVSQPTTSNPSFLKRMSYYISFPLHAILWALLQRKDYDVIVTTVPPIFTGITGYFMKKITGKTWVFDVRDLWIDASVDLGFIKKNSYFDKISRMFEELCYNVCDLITVTTVEIKNVIIKKYNISQDKIKVIPNGVDTKLFKPSNIKKNRIIYSGHLGTAQDLEKFILAFKKINEKFSLQFYIVGDGEIRQGLEELVKKEGLEDRIVFTGLLARDKIPNLIAESLIGIIPLKSLDSLEYAIPTKAYEYMSCGIPFVATGVGEIKNLAEVSNGGIVAQNNVNSIYENLIHLLENEKLMEKMRKHGRKFVEHHFDRRITTKHFLKYIQNVVR